MMEFDVKVDTSANLEEISAILIYSFIEKLKSAVRRLVKKTEPGNTRLNL